jgi:putative ABC transport system permease protein
MSLSQSSLTALNSGKVVAFYPEYVRGGKVTVNWWSGKQLRNSEGNVIHGEPSKSVSLDAVVQKPPHAVNFDMVMSPSTARAAGIAFVTSQLVTRTPTQPTDAQNDALAASGQAIFGRANVAYFNYEAGPPVYAGPAQWALLALCAIIALGAAAIAIGLARSEGRHDERILGSLGSPPRLRRAFSFWSAAIITGVGAIGGVVLGTIPALAVSESLSQTAGLAAVPFDLPWLPLLVAAIGLPLLIAVRSWLTAGRGRVNYNARAPIG